MCPLFIKHIQKFNRQNKLTELPEDMDRIRLLEILSISSNQLEELPMCLINMRRYVHTYLRAIIRKRLCVLNNSFLHCDQNMYIFYLSFLKFSLKKVYANGNKISFVPDDICLLPNIQVKTCSLLISEFHLRNNYYPLHIKVKFRLI